jgi:hypothetical protein
MKIADVKEWMQSEVTGAFFEYLDLRIKSLKDARGEGTLVSGDAQQMFRANWELVGGLKELQALRDLPNDDEQVYEVFGVVNDV